MKPASLSDERPREQRRTSFEFWAVLAVTAIGVAARCVYPSEMAVEHFDEGVYASNLWCPDNGFQYPDRHLYAPSLLPALIEWSLMLFGPTRWAPMVPSLVFGCLTVPLVWWVGRCWFGPAAGLAAATLAALSDYHILFSRSALTDVMLGFWLLLAVYFFENAFRTLSPARAVIAGVVTGLAWWTKYNGWLPLAISLSGLLAWSLFAPRGERQLGRRLLLWGLAAVIALAVWSPFWWSLPHGYSEIAANHRQYVVGFAGWWQSAERHFENLKYLDGRLSLISLGVGLSLSLFATTPVLDAARSLRGNQRLVIYSLSFVLLAGPYFLAAALLVLVACSIGTETVLIGYFAGSLLRLILELALSMATPHRQRKLHERASAPCPLLIEWSRPAWLITAWFVGLLLMTPTYRAYPRLALPTIVVSWFAVWFLVVSRGTMRSLAETDSRPHDRSSGDSAAWAVWKSTLTSAHAVLLFIVLPIVVGWFAWRGWKQHGVQCWQSRTGLAQLAPQVQEVTRREAARAGRDIGGKRAVLYVFAEPGLFYHLPADDLAVGTVGNLDFLNLEVSSTGLATFLVTGPHAHLSTSFEAHVAKHAARLELVQRWPYVASDFVLLDQVPPSQLDTERAKCEVRLYRVK